MSYLIHILSSFLPLFLSLSPSFTLFLPLSLSLSLILLNTHAHRNTNSNTNKHTRTKTRTHVRTPSDSGLEEASSGNHTDQELRSLAAAFLLRGTYLPIHGLQYHLSIVGLLCSVLGMA